MKKIILTLAVAAIVISCNQPVPATTATKAPVDSLIKAWSNCWNNHDSAGALNLFQPAALLIDDDLIATSKADIAAKWIHPNMQLVRNFKATEIQQWSSTDRAGYTGKYEFEAVVNDSVVAKPAGVFTVNWVMEESGDWKITTADIHGFSTPQ